MSMTQYRDEEAFLLVQIPLTNLCLYISGIICAEGALWRDQRKCTINWLRHLGMLKIHNNKRLQLEGRILSHVRNAVEVRFLLFMH